MFTWICPTCGREVPPAYDACPDCAARAKAGQVPAGGGAAAVPPPGPPPAIRRRHPPPTRLQPSPSRSGPCSSISVGPPLVGPCEPGCSTDRCLRSRSSVSAPASIGWRNISGAGIRRRRLRPSRLFRSRARRSSIRCRNTSRSPAYASCKPPTRARRRVSWS